MVVTERPIARATAWPSSALVNTSGWQACRCRQWWRALPGGYQRLGQVGRVHRGKLLRAITEHRCQPEPGQPKDLEDFPVSWTVHDGRPED